MQNYHHILVALDYSENRRLLIERSKHLAVSFQAKLSVIHILDNIPMPQVQYGSVIPLSHDLESDNSPLEHEKNKLTELAKELDIAVENCWLVWGVPSREIPEFAQEVNADLIIVGSHGRHGLALLLGSTANGVLHHAHCDVLSIRLPD